MYIVPMQSLYIEPEKKLLYVEPTESFYIEPKRQSLYIEVTKDLYTELGLCQCCSYLLIQNSKDQTLIS